MTFAYQLIYFFIFQSFFFVLFFFLFLGPQCVGLAASQPLRSAGGQLVCPILGAWETG